MMTKRLALCVAACALLAGGSSARASTALVGNVKATELRVAFADAAWSTVWTSLRVEEAGPFALVVPLPDGAYVDQSSDAWFEALEVATATRVLPPEGLNPYCPGKDGPADPFDVAGSTGHTESLAPETIALADDAAAVATWAQGQGLTLDGALETALGSAGAKRFLCVRFTSPGGAVTTPTLRVSAPQGLPTLPFSITRASAAPLRVSAWFVGEGRGDLGGTTAVPVPGSEVTWNAKTQTSDAVAARDALLSAQPDGVTLESTAHDAFATSVLFANDSASIDPVVVTYFQRAAAYGNAPSGAAACIAAAKPLFATAGAVSPTCPRGDLAAPPAACTPAAPGPGELDAAKLACGPGADDLAIALSGAASKTARLTRRTFVIAQGASGKDRTVTFGAGAAVQPVLEAGSVDVSDCFASGGSGGGGMGGSGGSTGTTTSTSTTPTTGGQGQGGSGAGTSGNGNGAYGGSPPGHGGWPGEGATAGDPYAYVDPIGCACNGTVDTTDTTATADSCDGSSPTSDPASDSCSGDSAGTTASDACSGDSAGTASDACSGDSAGTASDACSGDSAGTASDCAITHRPAGRRTAAPRLSLLTLAAIALVLPLRRRGTRKKRQA